MNIHFVFQAQNKESLQWLDVPSSYDGRVDPDLFSVLSFPLYIGASDLKRIVKEGTKSISMAMPKGLPAGFTQEERIGYYNQDSLTGEEILRWWEMIKTHPSIINKQQLEVITHLAYFFDEVKRLVELHGVIRFVFGFNPLCMDTLNTAHTKQLQKVNENVRANQVD